MVVAAVVLDSEEEAEEEDWEAVLERVCTRGLVCARRRGMRDSEGGRASSGVCGVRGELVLDPVEELLSSQRSASSSFFCWRMRLRGLLVPWIWSQHSSQTRAARTGDSGEA